MRLFASTTREVFFTAALIVAGVLALTPDANTQARRDAQNGRNVFEKLGCFRCHGSAGEGMPRTGTQPGSPKIVATKLSLRDFRQSVRKPTGQMPPFLTTQVSDEELSDVYAFLQSAASQSKLELPSSASSKDGEHLYTAFGCYECHGYQGQGSVQTGGSRIGPPKIPYSGFVGYIRQPAGEMPPYTSKALSDAQLADIYVFLQSRPPAVPSKSIPQLNQ